MQESNEPVLPKSLTDEAQCDAASTAAFESPTTALQNPVPANFVEIIVIRRPGSPDKQGQTPQELEEEVYQETEDGPDDETVSPEQRQIEIVVKRCQEEQEEHRKEQESWKKEPSESQITFEELSQNLLKRRWNATFRTK
jgi:hypothetical protein